MTGKLEKKASEKNLTNSTNVKKRGRPKGSKNKPKVTAEVLPKPAEKRGRGRPKGSKNKPKDFTPPLKCQVIKPEKVVAQKPAADNQTHPLLTLIEWLEKTMHAAQLQYYRSRASKNETTIQTAIASDILGFFNVQDQEICKQIKKNTFVVTNVQ